MKKKINVHFILDKSGSMDIIRNDTIKGFNDYVNTLKKDKKNEYVFSLTLFNDTVDRVYTQKKLSEIEKLDKKNYIPDGWTALYDAACTTIKNIKDSVKNNNNQHLVIIMTDGQENSSTKYTHSQFKKMVKELQDTKKWKFVFLGANQDAWATASGLGMSSSSSSSFSSTASGIKSAFSVLSESTIFYASAVNASVVTPINVNKIEFFTKEDQDLLKNTK